MGGVLDIDDRRQRLALARTRSRAPACVAWGMWLSFAFPLLSIGGGNVSHFLFAFFNFLGPAEKTPVVIRTRVRWRGLSGIIFL